MRCGRLLKAAAAALHLQLPVATTPLVRCCHGLLWWHGCCMPLLMCTFPGGLPGACSSHCPHPAVYGHTLLCTATPCCVRPCCRCSSAPPPLPTPAPLSLPPQVVLPDAKVAERDVVVWLEAGQAAGEAEEAEQRGAVAALHVLASGRNMQVSGRAGAGGTRQPQEGL